MKQPYLPLLLLLLLISSSHAVDCFSSFRDDLSISGDCDEISLDYAVGNTKVSTFISPRSITRDLTYRNCITFFNRFHDVQSCSFFMLDSAFIVQQTRKSVHLGRGFLGQNPLLIAQYGAPVNSTHLGLVSSQPEGFYSTVQLSPKRKVIAWMPQLILNLEGLCDCLWADLVCAVVQAKHEINLFEQIITHADDPTKTTVKEAFDQLSIFPSSPSHTGVDDVEARLGYTFQYCEDDMVGFYGFGTLPTGKKFNNSLWFEPHAGSRSGSFGAGIVFDSTLWYSEFVESECLLMTEFKYRYSLGYTDKRVFDLHNGPLSRFLLTAAQEDPNKSRSALQFLRGWIRVEPRHSLDWWIALHYTYHAWGFELGYNLWFQEREHISSPDINFFNSGIFDMTRTNNRTSHSKALLSQGPGEGTPDDAFVQLKNSDVNVHSAESQPALSHTVSGAVTYASNWGDYPIKCSVGVRYEAAGEKRHTSTLEGWGVLSRISVSF